METYRHSHEPTQGQLEAGNYRKPRRVFQGIRIAIETAAGTVRRGVDPDGNVWETRMRFDYGYAIGTLGTDGDAVDVFLGLNEEAPFVYLVDQHVPPDFDAPDEQKVMLGFDSMPEACAAYLSNYNDDRFLGAVTAMPVEEFRAKLKTERGALIKAMVLKALEPGERWITVHPNGESAKGVPVLIKEHPDGTASVIGGAGGKLNHLKLRGVKSKGAYKDSLREKHKERMEARRKQAEIDKASGVYDQKKAARKEISGEAKSQVADLIKEAQSLLGWSDDEVVFDEAKHADLTPEAQKKARADHERELLRKINHAVKASREWLTLDADARIASGLGEVPLLSAGPDALSVADLSPMPEVSGAKLGFDPKYQERAGISREDATVEATESGLADPSPPPSADTVAEKLELKAQIAMELESFKEKNPDTHIPAPKILDDAKKAAALLRIDKKMKLIKQKAREAIKAVDDAPDTVESKAAVLEVSDAEIDDATRNQLEDDVRTAGARTFLSAVDRRGGDSALTGHVNTGAFNALNAVSTAVGGDALLDRSVVDVLGVSGAAQVLARRIRSSLGGDADKVLEGIQEHHVANSEKLQAEAVSRADALYQAAADIELGSGSTGMDLWQAQAANDKRRQAVSEAQAIIGQAHGEMQATASLVAALGGNQDGLEVSLGGAKPEQAILQLRAIGLVPGDYHLEEAGGNLVATVTGVGMDRLAKPFDVEGMAQIRRNLDIMEGRHDEDGWLPGGVANRPDLSMHVEPGVAQRLAKPFSPPPGGAPEDIHGALADYIGGRMADGDAMVDILADAQSSMFFQKSGNVEAYRAALDALAPLKGSDGKMKPVESLRSSWEALADEFVDAHYGADRSPLHRQSFEVDQTSVDALHRALAAHPEGVAAYKPIEMLTPKDRNGLRNWWYANVAREDPGAAEARMALEAHEAAEPEKESADIFGGVSTNPEWTAWKSKRDQMAAELNASSLDWEKYVKLQGSPSKAIETVQDLVRSNVAHEFATAYNTLHPGSPIKLGKTTVKNNLNHLDAVDPDARKMRQANEKALLDSLRDRVAGKYASGSVIDKLDAMKQQKAAFEQSQMGFFASEELPEDQTAVSLGADERFTLGHAAEQKVAGMMSVMGSGFKPGQPTKLWAPSMSGGKNYARQRLVKMLEANKRVVAAFGTGSGKSLLQLAGFSHLHSKGKVKKGLILCPSIVQGQMGGEALRYLEPGKYKWHAEPGASREERLAAYRDPGTHFVVATHQSFRDDMIHLGAKHAQIPEDEMADRLQKMDPAERKAWARSVMDTEGFNVDYMSTDESQYTLNREGKENSRLANVVDGFGDNADYYMPSSGDPVKNDASEIHDLLSKMDRGRYGDRDAFMRKYGGDTQAAQEGLKREMARYVYSSKIDPDVKADRQTVHVDLNEHQKAAIADIDKAYARVRVARLQGSHAMDALKMLSPDSFKDAPEETHTAIAHQLSKSAGMIRNAAIKRIINSHPQGASMDAAASYADQRRGKPGVIFAHSLEAVANLKKRLEADGHKVVEITGGDSSLDKDKKRLAFNPETGDSDADILIASDAAATGMNLQRGRWLLQMDVPDTAMVHAQRNGRIFRTGQKNNVELASVEVNHPSVHKAKERLVKKYGLREMMTSPMEGMDDTGVAWRIHQKMAVQQGLF